MVGSSLTLAVSQQPGIKRSDRAIEPTAGSTQSARFSETITPAADEPIPKLPEPRVVKGSRQSPDIKRLSCAWNESR